MICLLSLAAVFSVAGCSKDPTKVEPETRGKRGENCQARNDCQTGLACINNICGVNEFSIGVEVKQCDRIECSTTDDCCGDKPTEAPARCNQRETKCVSTFPSCSTAQTCTSDSACNGGTCRPAATTGTCSGGNASLTGLTCQAVTDCQDRCVAEVCSISGLTCTDDTGCSYYSALTPVCNKPARTCDCANKAYDPTDAICSDPDCVDLCVLRCDDERCVPDLSCKSSTDCGGTTPYCDDAQCVQCRDDDDCTDGKSCDQGSCHAPCKHNEECPAFYACNGDSGECEYAGCKSDRECILAATANSNAESPPVSTSGEDPRLLKCLPSEADPKINTCKIPCENDGSCGAQSVCDGGYCKFIGCKEDEDCRAYLGLVGQVSTPARPYVPTAVCR